MAQGRVRVGTSGYQYDHWRGILYPPDLPKKSWFEAYAAAFDTVEINNTFYSLPAPGSFDGWRRRAPDGFLYALKFSRYGSHVKKLKDPDRSLGPFMERARRLKACLGPVLVQLPPRWRPDTGRLRAFLEAVPEDVRCAVELRDPAWLTDEVFQVLADLGAALCLHDMLPDHPRELTADWTYFRYHGDSGHGGSYSPQKLSADARHIRGWLADGLDVHAYFNNDLDGHAVRNAGDLLRHVLS